MFFQTDGITRIQEDGCFVADGTNKKYENTFRLEPHRALKIDPIEKIVKSVMTNNLEDVSYSIGSEFSQLCVKIAKDIREHIQRLNFDRQKIVVTMTIVEKGSQSFESSFACLWDPARDNYVTYTMETQSFFAYCCVFGVYYE